MNAGISDHPPDMRLKPPMRGEVDKNDIGRNQQYVESQPSNIMQDPYWGSGRMQKTGVAMQHHRVLSKGDIIKSKAPRY